MLCFETVPCLLEVQAILGMLQEEPALRSMPCWVSMCCRDGERTAHGESLAEDVVPALWAHPNVVAFGVNCIAPRHVVQLLQGAGRKLYQLQRGGGGAGGAGAAGARRPPLLLAYPNSGEAWDEQRRCWVEAPGLAAPDHFAQQAAEWVAAGARLVGGCCRTTPAHIARLREVLVGVQG